MREGNRSEQVVLSLSSEPIGSEGAERYYDESFVGIAFKEAATDAFS